MRKNLVSIVIPTYNRENFIVETLNSVYGQSYRPIEIIIVNDGSTDNSGELVKEWIKLHKTDSDKLLTKYIYQENRGAPSARNKGANISSGNYLMFLDSDDLLSEHVISSLVKAQIDSNCGISACPWYFIVNKKYNQKWNTKEGMPLKKFQRKLIKGWLLGWFIPSCALLWERSSFYATGGWDESLLANQDGDLMLRYLLQDGSIAFAENGKAFYRRYFGSASITNTVTIEKIRSREKVLKKVERGLVETGTVQNYNRELAVAFHALASKAYANNFIDYGNRLLKKSKDMHDNYQSGSLVHKTVENLVGLYYKEKLYKVFNYCRNLY